jgi:hypothetical protein
MQLLRVNLQYVLFKKPLIEGDGDKSPYTPAGKRLSVVCGFSSPVVNLMFLCYKSNKRRAGP